MSIISTAIASQRLKRLEVLAIETLRGHSGVTPGGLATLLQSLTVENCPLLRVLRLTGFDLCRFTTQSAGTVLAKVSNPIAG